MNKTIQGLGGGGGGVGRGWGVTYERKLTSTMRIGQIFLLHNDLPVGGIPVQCTPYKFKA